MLPKKEVSFYKTFILKNDIILTMLYYFIFSILATLIATMLGSLLSLLNNKMPKILEAFLQNFSVGIIIGLLFFEMIVESIGEAQIYFSSNLYIGVVVCVSIILITGILFFILHEILHKLSNHHKNDKDDDEACEDHAHTTELLANNQNQLIASLLFLGAISVHNIPEGLSLGAIFNTSSDAIPISGIIFSIALFIHNFFIGYSMSSSFLKLNKKFVFAFFITLLSSLPAFIFSLVGYFTSTTDSSLMNMIIFSISSGTLLYVLFIELLPQIFYKYKSKYSFLFILLGIIVSILIIFLG